MSKQATEADPLVSQYTHVDIYAGLPAPSQLKNKGL